MSTEDSERAVRDYQAHVARIRPVLPEGVRILGEAGGRDSLHDGRFAETSFQDSVLQLRIRGYDWTGDGAVPTQDREFRIVYYNATLLNLTEQEFFTRTSDAEAEILYCEFDLLPDGTFEHRVLLWPPRLGELAVGFRNATVETDR